jgi:putative membrane-bound dehydrogenase-like protein
MIALLWAAMMVAEGPVSPEESLARLILPDEFVAELVAAEPLVVDPVAMAFARADEMFVAEYRDYPLGPADNKSPFLSRIKRLRDTNGDGVMDASNVFAEGLAWCQGLAIWKKGLLATVAQELIYLEDADGDGVAESQQSLLAGLGQSNPQLLPAFPTVGRDGWIYLTNGLSGGKVHTTASESPLLELGVRDLRFHPRARTIEAVNGPGQFGQSIDDWSNRFTCSNRRPIIHDVIPLSHLSTSGLITMDGNHDVARSGGESKVYPAQDTATTAFSHTGTHTAACGVLVFRGTGLGDDMNGTAFVCDPTGYLVACHRLIPDGMTFRSERILNQQAAKLDWLTSTDSWFRPVSLANGPDGSLYVVDMYREVIEHPAYMPAGLAQTLNLRAGDDRGRVYRVRRRSVHRTETPITNDRPTLIETLSHAEGWWRDHAWRLLWEGESEEIAGMLREGVTSLPTPEGRLGALTLLACRDELDDATLDSALLDADHRVQAAGWELGVDRIAKNPGRWSTGFAESLRHPSPRVRSAAARSAARSSNDREVALLVRFIQEASDEPFLWESLREELAPRGTRLLKEALQGAKDEAPASLRKKYHDLALLSAATGRPADVVSLLQWVVTRTATPATSMAIITGIMEGSRSSPHPTLRPGAATGADSVLGQVAIRPWNELAQRISLDATAEPGIRQQALDLLAIISPNEMVTHFVELATRADDDQVSSRAIQLLSRSGADFPLDRFVATWARLSPATQERVLAACWDRTASIRQVLDEMKRGTLSQALVPIDRRELLLSSGDSVIRENAIALFGERSDPDRAAVIDQYRASMNPPGNPVAGHEVFRRVCAVCHRLGKEGTAVGPDISDVRNKTADQLLGEILDPNRVVEPRFTASTVLTTDGRSSVGILGPSTEGSIMLTKSGGQQEQWPRAEIEQIQTTTQSLMPVGIEKEITPQQMNDLIAFLRTGR